MEKKITHMWNLPLNNPWVKKKIRTKNENTLKEQKWKHNLSKCGERPCSTGPAKVETGILKKPSHIPGPTTSTGKNLKSVDVQITSYSPLHRGRDPPLKTVSGGQMYNTQHWRQKRGDWQWFISHSYSQPRGRWHRVGPQWVTRLWKWGFV